MFLSCFLFSGGQIQICDAYTFDRFRWTNILRQRKNWSTLDWISFILLCFILFLFYLPSASCSISSTGVLFPRSVRPGWRRCGNSSWQPTAPQLAWSLQPLALLAPFRVCSSSLFVELVSAPPALSSEPCQRSLISSVCTSVSHNNKVPNVLVYGLSVDLTFVWAFFSEPAELTRTVCKSLVLFWLSL